MSNIPMEFVEEEVLSRVRPSSCGKWNDLSKCKSYVVMDLPEDLVEEVLSRVPFTYLRKLRSTCKTWNALSRSKSFAKKHLAVQRELNNTVVMVADYKLSLISINLDDKEELCKSRPKRCFDEDEDDEQTDISQVFHHYGLLFCLSRGENRLVVWNPYLGLTRWIDPKPNLHNLSSYVYAFGYDRSTNSHKILRFVIYDHVVEFNMYDLKSGSNGSWRVLDLGKIPSWTTIENHKRGVSLEGNTYWCATYRGRREGRCFLKCFDFTRDRFGPRLPLPPSIIRCHPEDTLSLSSVREEQLVVLYQPLNTLRMEIWITTKIKPNHVSWSNKFFLQVNMRPLTGYFQFLYSHASFFIDEEKKVAVVFDKDKDDGTHNVAYIVGADGSLKEVDLGESPNKHCFPLVCPYFPSSLLLN